MQKENHNKDQKQNAAGSDINPVVIAAHIQADKDIEKDPDLGITPDKADDLDEGELARLEGED
ncbi:MAG: hypothetical protein H0W12_06835 [Chitinophagaceae bacterium]|nr:hypothetical protein [Chitinophagaceae bacterium]